jgi:DNA-binding transcriptional LysR family regulator
MSDRISALKLFVRVARTESFSRAGRELGYSQPSASRVMAKLERDIGAALFTRTTRAVKLTEAGADYLAQVEPILAALDEADHAARGTGELRGVLRVGLSSSFAVREVIPHLPDFMKRHPALRIELLMTDQRQDLVIDGIDVALRFGALNDSTAVARQIGVWPRILAASPAYLAETAIPETPADLAAHTVIIGPASAASSWSFRRDNRVMSVRVEGRLTASINEGSVAAALAGLGIISTSLWGCCRRELASGALVRVLPDWDMGSVEMHAVFASGRAAKPAARAFAEFLIAELRATAAPSKLPLVGRAPRERQQQPQDAISATA